MRFTTSVAYPYPQESLKRHAGEHAEENPPKRRCLGIFYYYPKLPIPQPNIRETDDDYIIGTESKRQCLYVVNPSGRQVQQRHIINYDMEEIREQARSVTARLLRDFNFSSSSTFDLPSFIHSFLPRRFKIMETLEVQWSLHWARSRGVIVVDENRFDLCLGNVSYSFPNVRKLYASIQGPSRGTSRRFDPYIVLKRIDRVMRMLHLVECTIALPMCAFARLVKEVHQPNEDDMYYRDLNTVGVWRSPRDGTQAVVTIEPSLGTFPRPGKSHVGDDGYLVVGGVQNDEAEYSTIFAQDFLALSLGGG